jgi:LPXTG-site transpeptidase (sortase) family protein
MRNKKEAARRKSQTGLKLLYLFLGIALLVGGTGARYPKRQQGIFLEYPTRPATQITIPRLKLQVPVMKVPYEREMGSWDLSDLGYRTAHLEGTANPGSASNTVLAAHNVLPSGADGPFKHLSEMQPGDTIIVHVNEQAFRYRIAASKIVPPAEVEVVFPTEEPTLTLMTCAGWDAATQSYTGRLVVIGHLVEEAQIHGLNLSAP